MAAARVIERIVEATHRLQQFPNSGRTGQVPGTRELVVAGLPYIVAYKIRPTAIDVVRVLHGARKWPPNFD
jgi:addiction module RelE/StbE family toxin